MDAIITLHGGGFTGGSVNWDRKQNVALESLGLKVYQLDFPTNNFEDCMSYLQDKFNQIKSNHPRVFLLGRSSGGYLAKQLFERNPLDFTRVFYLAPVFNPELRAKIYPKFKNRQEFFFRKTTTIPSTKLWDETKEVLFVPHRDQNVPLKCYTLKQLKGVIDLGIQTHSGLCCTCSKLFLKTIKRYLK